MEGLPIKETAVILKVPQGTVASRANKAMNELRRLLYPDHEQRPRILLFALDQDQIERGESTTLRWQVENADTVSIAPGIQTTVNRTGFAVISPSQTTMFTLTASRAGG